MVADKAHRPVHIRRNFAHVELRIAPMHHRKHRIAAIQKCRHIPAKLRPGHVAMIRLEPAADGPHHRRLIGLPGPEHIHRQRHAELPSVNDIGNPRHPVRGFRLAIPIKRNPFQRRGINRRHWPIRRSIRLSRTRPSRHKRQNASKRHHPIMQLHYHVHIVFSP